MDRSFGTRLRLQRERQGIELAAVAAETKIKLSLLAGLECDDLSEWPEGIFRRAYVRSYARVIGLDPDPVVREFLTLYPDAIEEIPDILSSVAAAGEESGRRRPPTRLEILVGAAINALPGFRPQPVRRARLDLTNGATSDRDWSPGRMSLGLEAGPSNVIPMNAPAATDESTIEPAAAVAEPDLHAVATAIEPASIALSCGSPTFGLVGPDLPPATPANAPRADEQHQPQDQQPREAASMTHPGVVRGRIDSADGRRFERHGRDLAALADLCTRLGRAVSTRDVALVCEDAAATLDAVGLTVWVWDPRQAALRPVLAHGYSGEVLARLPRVRFDADNAIAAAFRSAETHLVHGSDAATGAVAVPLLTPTGCVGVLAIELRHGDERHESVRAMAAILAAQLSTLVGAEPVVEALRA